MFKKGTPLSFSLHVENEISKMTILYRVFSSWRIVVCWRRKRKDSVSDVVFVVRTIVTFSIDHEEKMTGTGLPQL